MGNQRVAQLSTSDDDEEGAVVFKRLTRSVRDGDDGAGKLNSKRARVSEVVDGEAVSRVTVVEQKEKEIEGKQGDGEEDMEEDAEEEEQEPEEDAKPIGEAVRVSGKGRGRKSHFQAFEFDGNRYDLEDPVLLVPEEKGQKPYVAIITDITQAKDGIVMLTGQWFYRPEEAEKKGGGNWQSNDTRELFYSFHRDDVPAESVMHKCEVHFIPIHKQIPSRKQHPGFIVQKVYDTVEKKLWKLTDKDYEDSKQHEIDLLVQKTLSRLVDLPDIIPEENTDHEELLKVKRSSRRRHTSPSDVSKEEDASMKPETPGAGPANANEYTAILVQFNVLTGDNSRDKWLEKLLQTLQPICSSEPSENGNEKSVETSVGLLKSGKPFTWPDDAVSATTSLEKASNDALAADFHKYNQKMRQLMFNLKTNAFLARRLLSGELEPSKILNMTPTELKEGLMHEETATQEPEELKQIQMTDARCSRCSEFKVGLKDIIHAGHGDRYQLECTACGHSWYASRDAISILSISAPNSAANVGTAPWATAKFDSVEKQLNSPREPGKANEALKKSSEAYMPVLERQKSLVKPRINEVGPEHPKKAVDEGPEPPKGAE